MKMKGSRERDGQKEKRYRIDTKKEGEMVMILRRRRGRNII